MHQSRHKSTTNNKNNALGSSDPMPTVQDVQGVILPPPTANEPSDSEKDEEVTQDEHFTLRRNPTRHATRNVCYTKKNYTFVGLS